MAEQKAKIRASCNQYTILETAKYPLFKTKFHWFREVTGLNFLQGITTSLSGP